MADDTQLCTFVVDDLYLGIEVTKVREVIRRQATTPVPLAGRVVTGLINLRGEIVTALDLRRRLGLADGAEPPRMNVVVWDDDGAVSLLVDEIGDVVTVAADTFEPPPETLSGPARDLFTGAYKLKDRLLLVLDTDKTLRLADAA